MPSNQKQMIEQAKFTYCPLGKAFEKQIKATEYQVEKQVKALNTLKTIKGNESNDNEKSSTHKEILDKLYRERIAEIYSISKEIDFNNLTHYCKDLNFAPIHFIGVRGPLSIYEEIKNGNVSIEKIEEEQKQFKSKLNEITTGNPKTKSKEQLYTITNIKNFYNSREKVVKLYNDYAKIILETMYKANQGRGLKILTPKQMLQRLHSSCSSKSR